MKIRLFVKDLATGKTLEDLGACVCDSPSRAADLYNNDRQWCEKGYNAVIAWETLEDK